MNTYLDADVAQNRLQELRADAQRRHDAREAQGQNERPARRPFTSLLVLARLPRLA